MTPDDSPNRFSASFRHALDGIRATARGRSFRVQAVLGVVAVVLGVALHIRPGEWVAVALCIGLVLGGECANTAMEAAVDLACPQRHPLAKLAKDAAAGYVLLLSMASAIVGAIIFLPRILALLFPGLSPASFFFSTARAIRRASPSAGVSRCFSRDRG